LLRNFLKMSTLIVYLGLLIYLELYLSYLNLQPSIGGGVGDFSLGGVGGGGGVGVLSLGGGGVGTLTGTGAGGGGVGVLGISIIGSSNSSSSTKELASESVPS
jgi:hypothetical protein